MSYESFLQSMLIPHTGPGAFSVGGNMEDRGVLKERKRANLANEELMRQQEARLGADLAMRGQHWETERQDKFRAAAQTDLETAKKDYYDAVVSGDPIRLDVAKRRLQELGVQPPEEAGQAAPAGQEKPGEAPPSPEVKPTAEVKIDSQPATKLEPEKVTLEEEVLPSEQVSKGAFKEWLKRFEGETPKERQARMGQRVDGKVSGPMPKEEAPADPFAHYLLDGPPPGFPGGPLPPAAPQQAAPPQPLQRQPPAQQASPPAPQPPPGPPPGAPMAPPGPQGSWADQARAQMRGQVRDALQPLVDNAKNDDERAAALQAQKMAEGLVGTLKGGRDDAIKYGAELYEKLMGGLAAKRAAQGGGSPGQIGGVAAPGKDWSAPTKEGRARWKDADSHVRAWAKTQGSNIKFNEMNVRQQNLAAASSRLDGDSSALGQRVALGEAIKATFGARFSDTDLNTILDSGGLRARLEKTANFLVGGGELSATVKAQLAADVAEAQVRIAKQRREYVGAVHNFARTNAYISALLSPEEREAFANDIAGLLMNGGSLDVASGGGGGDPNAEADALTQ